MGLFLLLEKEGIQTEKGGAKSPFEFMQNMDKVILRRRRCHDSL